MGRHVVRSLRSGTSCARRTLFTALGVAGAITALVTVLGMLDSYVGTARQADDELSRSSTDRVFVRLDTFYAIDSPAVRRIRSDDRGRRG